MTAPSMLGPGGYPATTVPGLIRSIADIYAAVATIESIAAPKIRFGRRYVEQIDKPPRIVLVMGRGPWGGPQQIGAGRVSLWSPSITAYIWAPEPTTVSDELESELLRFDALDPMLYRFLNTLSRVAAGRIEPTDVDPNEARGQNPGAVNYYGETYAVSFRFLCDVPRDATVFNVLPATDTNGKPTPQISPPPIYNVNAGDFALTLVVAPKE